MEDLVIEMNELVQNGAVSNLLTGMGTTTDSNTYNALSPVRILNWFEIDEYYLNPILAKVCDAKAEHLADTKLEIESDYYDIEKHTTESNLSNYLCKVLDAIKLENLYGGCLIVAVKNGFKIEFITVDCSRAIPDNPIEPKEYNINCMNGITITVPVENTYRFNGYFLPDRIKQFNRGWGLSIFQRVLQAVIDFETDTSAVSILLRNLNVLVYGVKDLSVALSTEKNMGQMKNNLANVFECLALYKILPIDSSMTEATFINRSVSGVDALVQQTKDYLQTVTDLPSIILWGKSAGSSLSNGGDSELELWGQKCNSLLVSKVLPAIKWMILQNYSEIEREFVEPTLKISADSIKASVKTLEVQSNKIEEDLLKVKSDRIVALVAANIMSIEQAQKELGYFNENSEKILAANSLTFLEDEVKLNQSDIEEAIQWANEGEKII
jgi:hypothetical protein